MLFGLQKVYKFMKFNLSIKLFKYKYYVGMGEYTKQGYETAAKSFRPADLDLDLKNKEIMITGECLNNFMIMIYFYQLLNILKEQTVE